MEETKESVQRWEMIEGGCTAPGLEGIPVYGVRAYMVDGGVWEFPDVDASPRQVERLLRRLRQAAPEACHFAELVEDFIAELVTL